MHQVTTKINSVQALMHLLKAYVGTGILAMPLAFSHSGFVIGIIGTTIIGILCNSCIHMLLEINVTLCRQLKCEPMDYEKIMPLYSAMKNKHNFGKTLGVVNISIGFVICLYILVGLAGYIKYGDQVTSVITLSLPNEPLYNSVLIMYTFAIVISYSVQMHVVIEQLWPRLESMLLDHFQIRQLFIQIINYVFRALLVILTFALAAFIPRLDLIIALVGAISCSSIAIIIPPILHTIYCSTIKMNGTKRVFIYLRNLIIFIIGLLGFITGAYFSIKDI
ncbi:neutral amino acid uniporter 4-like, partial [Oppia nitens]|uniref:neutral amino acid uniporter 4-like n=1 Tax=Oppia nitens TaxID=1686743 RepID=UPI0023D9872C